MYELAAIATGLSVASVIAWSVYAVRGMQAAEQKRRDRIARAYTLRPSPRVRWIRSEFAANKAMREG